MENRKRNVHLHVMVTPDELAAIHERMAEAGISNAGAYVRKMALNGYILHIDLAPVKELISLQRRCSNNLNQVAIHAHTYGVYPEEIDGLKRDYEKLWARCQRCCGAFRAGGKGKTRAAGSDVGTCRLVLFTIYIYVSENVIPEVQPLYK